MSRALWLLVGIVVGALVSQSFSGCCSGGATRVPTSQFVGASSGTAEADYSLVVAPDRLSVTETFTRSGRTVENIYRVTKEGTQ